MLMLNIHSGKTLLQRCQLEGEHWAPVYLTRHSNSNQKYSNQKYLCTARLPRNYKCLTFFEVVNIFTSPGYTTLSKNFEVSLLKQTWLLDT